MMQTAVRTAAATSSLLQEMPPCKRAEPCLSSLLARPFMLAHEVLRPCMIIGLLASLHPRHILLLLIDSDYDF